MEPRAEPAFSAVGSLHCDSVVFVPLRFDVVSKLLTRMVRLLACALCVVAPMLGFLVDGQELIFAFAATVLPPLLVVQELLFAFAATNPLLLVRPPLLGVQELNPAYVALLLLLVFAVAATVLMEVCVVI